MGKREPNPFAREWPMVELYLLHTNKLRRDALRWGHETMALLPDTPEPVGGLVDFWALVGRTLHIVDLKTGKAQVVVKDNSQLKLYALGVLPKLESWPIDTVTLCVVQPTAVRNPLREWDITPLDLLSWGEYVRRVVSRIVTDKNLHLETGSHCYFCPARQAEVCPAQQAKRVNTARAEFDTPIEE
jgi:hypothetical protein